MKKLCGVVVATVMVLGITCGPAAAVAPGAQDLPYGGLICLVFPKRCW